MVNTEVFKKPLGSKLHNIKVLPLCHVVFICDWPPTGMLKIISDKWKCEKRKEGSKDWGERGREGKRKGRREGGKEEKWEVLYLKGYKCIRCWGFIMPAVNRKEKEKEIMRKFHIMTYINKKNKMKTLESEITWRYITSKLAAWTCSTTSHRHFWRTPACQPIQGKLSEEDGHILDYSHYQR